MPFEKKPAGTQRTLIYKVRLRPEFKEQVANKLAWLRQFKGYENATISVLIRLAISEYCKDPDDPREA